MRYKGIPLDLPTLSLVRDDILEDIKNCIERDRYRFSPNEFEETMAVLERINELLGERRIKMPMTNREWLNGLSDEELTEALYTKWMTREAFINWLSQPRRTFFDQWKEQIIEMSEITSNEMTAIVIQYIKEKKQLKQALQNAAEDILKFTGNCPADFEDGCRFFIGNDAMDADCPNDKKDCWLKKWMEQEGQP